MIFKLGYVFQRLRTFYLRFGVIATLKYAFYNGIIKRIVNRYHYLRYRKDYQQHLIFIISLPKGGSTWVSRLFASIQGFAIYSPRRWNITIGDSWSDQRWNLYRGLFEEFKHKLAVVKGHTWAHPGNISQLRESNIKYLITVRDPRDQVISEYWHCRNYPLHWDRQLAMSTSPTEFITYKFDSGAFERETLSWLRMWIKNREPQQSIMIRYEDLLRDPEAVFRKALNFLGFQLADDELRRIIEINSFEAITARKPGQAADHQFNRKGIAGEWKEVYTGKLRDKFLEIGEDVVQELGYEPTR